MQVEHIQSLRVMEGITALEHEAAIAHYDVWYQCKISNMAHSALEAGLVPVHELVREHTIAPFELFCTAATVVALQHAIMVL